MKDYTKYFKEKKGFDRFIELLYKKYQSYGKVSGIIKLNNINKDESIALSNLFGTRYEEESNLAISISKFIKIMESSKYEDFNINSLISEYLGKDLITKKELSKYQKEEFIKFLSDIKDNEKTDFNKYIEYLINTKNKPYNLIKKKYRENKKLLKLELKTLSELINNLPKTTTPLAIYASNITTNPHYLDLDSNNINLFLYMLSFIDNSSFPINREDKIKLLGKYNIEIDNLSNFIITYNILSNKDYYNSFSKNKETLILNIHNIINTEFFDTKKKKVFIFENPSLLTEILQENIDIPVIISNGFANISLYLLLDKLIEKNNKLYYNGDFDPEGLIIASKLKDRYKDKINLFCYEKIDYDNCISSRIISPTRINKLNKINTSELEIIKRILKEKHLAAYQENNKERIINEIKNIMKG